MNRAKLNGLIQAARRRPAPLLRPGFEARVLAAVRQEAASGREGSASWLGGLEAMFPRLVWAAVTVLALCAAAEVCAGALGVPDLSRGLAQLSDQWLLAASGF